MKWLNGDRMKLMFMVTMVGVFFVGGNAKADFTFGEPVNMGQPVNSYFPDIPDCITADGLEMYINSFNRTGGYGGFDEWMTKRNTIGDEWSAPVNLGQPINSGRHDGCGYISVDGLELYLHLMNRPGGLGNYDIWISRRDTREDAWGEPLNLGPRVNSSSGDACPWVSPDGLELYFSSTRSGGYGDYDIWVSRRATKDDPWGQVENLGPIVNSSASECWVSLSSDGLILFVSEEVTCPIRPGGYGNVDMWMTRRTNVSDPWGEPVNLGPTVNSSSLDCRPMTTCDGLMLYFCSDRPGGLGGAWYGDIYQAPIVPIVDFNGDRIVDAEDMCIMVDHWGTDNQLCDIGPMPWGDGVVDVQDLIVLVEHLFEQLPGRPINP